jgi:hypothetical protein
MYGGVGPIGDVGVVAGIPEPLDHRLTGTLPGFIRLRILPFNVADVLMSGCPDESYMGDVYQIFNSPVFGIRRI